MLFDIVVDKTPTVCGLTSLEETVAAYLHLCFVTRACYPEEIILCSLLFC